MNCCILDSLIWHDLIQLMCGNFQLLETDTSSQFV